MLPLNVAPGTSTVPSRGSLRKWREQEGPLPGPASLALLPRSSHRAGSSPALPCPPCPAPQKQSQGLRCEVRSPHPRGGGHGTQEDPSQPCGFAAHCPCLSPPTCHLPAPVHPATKRARVTGSAASSGLPRPVRCVCLSAAALPSPVESRAHSGTLRG